MHTRLLIATATALCGLYMFTGCASETGTSGDTPASEEALRARSGGGAGDGATASSDRVSRHEWLRRIAAKRGHRGHGHHRPHRPPHNPPTLTCDNVRCAAGTHCELQEIVCITTPCNPIPACVPDEPPPPSDPFCGGIAGFPCEGAAECVDNPNDECDPTMGGADCGGICECNSLGLCIEGFVWNSAPEVCDCVEDLCPLTDCPDATTCEMQGSEAVCVPQAPTSCAVVLCQVGTTCVEENGTATCVPNGATECGPSICAEGQVCCNESCGICTPPDGVCIQLFCES